MADAWASFSPAESLLDRLLALRSQPSPSAGVMNETLIRREPGPEYGVRSLLPQSPETGQNMLAEMLGRGKPQPGTPSASTDLSWPMWARFLPAPSSPGENVALAANILGGPRFMGGLTKGKPPETLGYTSAGLTRRQRAAPEHDTPQTSATTQEVLDEFEAAARAQRGLYRHTPTTEGIDYQSAGATRKRPGETKGIRAYHGSPHKFDRFDMSKIGTGEGAQAYGHGLYFAENPAVAESYKGTVPNGLHPLNPRNMWTPAELPSGKGHMYEVNIRANPEQFLDWDKPLSGQSANAKLQDYVGEINRLGLKGDYKDFTSAAAMTGMPGEWFMRAATGGQAPKLPALTADLKAAGIPGIKYLDQGSRGLNQPGIDLIKRDLEAARTAGNFDKVAMLERDLARLTPTSNYVLFDDSIIDILKRYGLMGGTAGGAAWGAYPSSAEANQ